MKNEAHVYTRVNFEILPSGTFSPKFFTKKSAWLKRRGSHEVKFLLHKQRPYFTNFFAHHSLSKVAVHIRSSVFDGSIALWRHEYILKW